MFEGVVVGLLNKYLGEFIEGLTKDQLSAGVFSGKVELKDLNIKPSGLNFLNLPIKVKFGSVGRLYLVADWKRLGSKAVEVLLEDVYVTVEPRTDFTVDEKTRKAEAEKTMTEKIERLKNVEDMKLSPEVQEASKGGNEDNFTSRLTAKVIDNIQVTVKNIHIRYEDMRDPQRPLVLGICLQELSAFTTDENWLRKFIVGAKTTYKLVNLVNFLIYFNTSPSTAREIPKTGMTEIFGALTNKRAPNVQYLLNPMSGSVKLILNKDTFPAPKIRVDARIDAIGLSLSEVQYMSLLEVLASITTASAKNTLAVQGFAERFRTGTDADLTKYVALYKRTLNAPWLPVMTDTDNAILAQMDKDIRYDDLARYRALSIAELRKELKGKPVTRRVPIAKPSLTQRLFGSSKSKNKEEKDSPDAISDEERKRLYADLDYNPADEGKKDALPRDYVNVEVAFALGAATIALLDRSDQDLFRLAANGVTVAVQLRPDSMALKLRMASVSLTDRFTVNTLYPDLVSVMRSNVIEHKSALALPAPAPAPVPAPAKGVIVPAKSGAIVPAKGAAVVALPAATPVAPAAVPFLVVDFESKPLDNSADTKINVICQATACVVHAAWIDRIMKFFIPPRPVDLQVAADWSAQTLMALQQSTSVSVADAFKSHTTLSLTVSLAAPVIIIPVSATDRKSDVLIVNLGHLALTSPILQTKADIARMKNKLDALVKSGRNPDDELLDERDRATCYDRWNIQLTRLEAFLAADGPSWANSTHASLLHEFTLNINLDRCVAPDIVWLPRMKLAGELPKLALNISSVRVRRILALAGSFATLGQAAAGPDMIITGDAAAKLQLGVSVGVPITKGRDKNAVLTLEELTLVLKSEKDAKQLLREIDADGNGEVSIGEYEAWLVGRRNKTKLDRQLQLSFTLSQIVLTISNDLRTPHYDVVQFKIDDIGLVMTKRTFDMRVALHVKSMSLEDKLTKYTAPQYSDHFKYILTTTPAGHKHTSSGHHLSQSAIVEQKAIQAGSFVTVDVVMTNRESPDFVTTPVEQKIDLGVGALILGVDPEMVQKLALFFIKDFMPPAPAAAAAPASATAIVPAKAAAATVSPSTGSKSPETKSVAVASPAKAEVKVDKKQPRDTFSKMRVTATFGGVKVFLNAKGQPIARIAISGFGAKFNQFEHSLSANVELSEISIADLTPSKSLYKDIVKVTRAQTTAGRAGAAVEDDEKPLVSVQFDTYSTNESTYPGHNGELNASIQGLRFVFLMRFIQELQYFATAGPIAQLLITLAADTHTPAHATPAHGTPAHASPAAGRGSASSTTSPSTAVAVVAKSPSLTAETKPFEFFKITANLSDVELIIPRASTSLEGVTARIESVRVSNSVERDRKTPPGSDDRYMKFQARLSRFIVATNFSLLRGPAPPPAAITTGGVVGVATSVAPPQLTAISLVDVDSIAVVADLMAHRFTTELDANLGDIDMRLSQKQFVFLLTFINGNLGEKSVVCVPDPPAVIRARGGSTVATSARKLSDARQLAKSKEPAPLSYTNVGVRMALLKFELMEDHGLRKTDSLVHFTISGLATNLGLVSDGGMTLELGIASVILQDMSKIGANLNGKRILTPYRELLSLAGRKRTLGETRLLTMAGGETKPLSVKLSKPGATASLETPMVIEVDIRDFRFTMGAVLLQLPSFFVMPAAPAPVVPIVPDEPLITSSSARHGAPLAAIGEDEEEKAVVVAPVAAPSPTAAATPVAPIHITVRMREPYLQLVTDPTKATCLAVTLTWALDTKIVIDGANIDVNADLKDIAVLHTDLDATVETVPLVINTNSSTPIIAPFSLGAKFQQYPSRVLKGQNAMMVEAELGLIYARFTYQDYRLLLAAVAALAPPAAAAAPAPAVAPVTSAPVLAGESKSLRITTDDAYTDSTAAARGRAAQFDSAAGGRLALEDDTDTTGTGGVAAIAPSFGEQSVTAKIGGFQLELINDCLHTNIPIARFKIDNVAARIHAFSHDRHITAGLGLSADFFNNSNVEWEPMIEPWSLKASVHQAIDPLNPKAPPATSAQLSSDKNFDLNVTHAMVAGVQETLSLLTLAGSAQSDSKQHSSYLFENNTEFDIRFFRVNRSAIPSSDGDGQVIDISGAFDAPVDRERMAADKLAASKREELREYLGARAWEGVPFDFPSSSDVHDHCVTLELLQYPVNYGWGAITVPVSRTRASSHVLSGGAGPAAILICELTIRGGQKVLSVHSTVGVINHTKLPITLQAADVNTKPSLQPKVLQPGQTLWVPVLPQPRLPTQGSPSDISVRLRSDESHEWCAPLAVTHPRDSKSQAVSFFACNGLTDAVKPTAFSFTASSKNDEGHSIPYTLYHLRTPIIVENLLAVSCIVDVLEQKVGGKALEVGSKELARGDEYEVTSASMMSGKTMISVAIPSLGVRSKPMDIRTDAASASATKVMQLSLIDEKTARQFYLSVETSFTPGSMRVVLFAPYWIFDMTNLGIIASEDKRDLIAGSRALPDVKTAPTWPAPFVMRDVKDNKTGSSVIEWDTKNGADIRGVFMFGYSPASLDGKSQSGSKSKHVHFTTSNIRADWSPPTTMETVGFTGSVSIPGVKNDMTVKEATAVPDYEVGIEINFGGGRFRRTRIITLAPKYLITNRLSVPIVLRQYSTAEATAITLAPGEISAYYWPRGDRIRTLSFRREPLHYVDWHWSGFFEISQVQDIGINVRHKTNGDSWFARVEVRSKGPSAYVLISEYEQKASVLRYELPYIIENRCFEHTFRFRQPCLREEVPFGVWEAQWRDMPPCTRVSYTWEQPTHTRQLAIEVGRVMDPFGNLVRYQQSARVSLDDARDLETFELTMAPSATNKGRTKCNVYAYVDTEGPTNVLVISDFPSPDVVLVNAEDEKSRETQEKQLAAQKDATINELLESQRTLESDVKQLTDSISKEREQLDIIKKLPRRPSIPGHTSELRLQVLEGRGFAAKQKALYVNVEFNGIKERTKTANKKDTDPVWQHPCLFNATKIDERAEVKLTVMNEGTFSDDVIGRFTISLAELKSHAAVEKWFSLKDPKSGDELGRSGSRSGHTDGSQPSTFVSLSSQPDHPPAPIHHLSLSPMSPSPSHGEFSDDAANALDPPRPGSAAADAIAERKGINDRAACCGCLSREKKLPFGNTPIVPSHVTTSTNGDNQGASDIGSVRMYLWWIPKSVQRVEQSVELILDQLAERRRVLNQCVEMLDELRPSVDVVANRSQSKLRMYARGRTAKFDIQLRALKNVVETARQLCGDDAVFNTSRIVCNVECPAIDRLSSIVVFDHGQLLMKDWVQDFTLYIPETTLSQSAGDVHVKFSFYLYSGDQHGNLPMTLASTTVLLAPIPVVTDGDVADEDDGNGDEKKEEKGAKAPKLSKKEIAEVARREWLAKWIDLISPHTHGAPLRARISIRRCRAVAIDQRATYALSLALPRIGLSMVDDVPRELLYISLTGLELELEDAPSQQTVEFKLWRLQIDNQQPKAPFPVIFAPAPVAKEDIQPFLQLSLNKEKNASFPVHIFQYFSLLIQTMDVKIEEAVIYTVLQFVNDFAKASGVSTDISEALVTRRTSLQLAVPDTFPTKLFFKWLQIQPIAVNLSFAVSPQVRTGSKIDSFSVNPFSILLTLLGSIMGNIDSSPLRLNGKIIENAYGTISTVVGSLVKHYTYQGLGEIYKILGSFEFLGNPLGLVNNLGSGVADFFHEPAKGLVKSPKDFGKGLAKGSLSLLKGAVGGVFTAASKITGSVGKGVAALTMDQEYVTKYSQKSQKQPEHLGQGLVTGVKSVGKGLLSGVTGLVVDPYKGMKEGGVGGFFKGVGKGLIGVVAKPTAGVLDLGSQTLKGIANTTTAVHNWALDLNTANKPIRYPRYIPPTRVLVAYNELEAQTMGPGAGKESAKELAATAKAAEKAEKKAAAAASSSTIAPALPSPAVSPAAAAASSSSSTSAAAEPKK